MKKTGYVIGFQGVEKTVDCGDSWETVLTGMGGWGTAVFFIDSLTGWAGNTLGKIYKTTNAGEDWEMISKLNYKWHTKIKFLNPSVGWVVGRGLYGYYGYIYKTIDGGYTWQLQDSLPNTGYYDILVQDSLNAWVVGENGRVKFTYDGGQYWYDSPTGFTHNIYGITEHKGEKWVVGGRYYEPIIYKKRKDVWNLWVQKNQNITNENINAVDFSDFSTGWLAGSNGALFNSHNEGKTWTQVPIFSVNFTSLSMPNPSYIFLAGECGEFVRSNDAGLSWKTSYVSDRISSPNEVLFFSDSLGYFFNPTYGMLFKTTDQGDNWISINDYFDGIFFLNSTYGWAYFYPFHSERTIIYRTEDGGMNWVDTLEVDDTIRNLFFYNQYVGWCASDNSLYATEDGGKSWRTIYLSNQWGMEVFDIHFVTEKDGYLLINDERHKHSFINLYYTNDGGMSLYPIKKYTLLKKLFLFDKQRGIAVGDEGQIFLFENNLVSIESRDDEIQNRSYALFHNFPNPFNSTTSISYRLLDISYVDLSIYNLLGQRVSTLVSARQPVGEYTIEWDGSGNASGVYLYKLATDKGFSETRKMVLIR